MTGTSVGSDPFEEDPSAIRQFVCDNIVWLPYTLWDEPLYILSQIEVSTGILACNVQSQFKDALSLTEDDEEALDNKLGQTAQPSDGNQHNFQGHDQMNFSESMTGNGNTFTPAFKSHFLRPLPPTHVLQELIQLLKAYYMLIWSKHVLRELYGVTDLKVQDYSPNENQKVWDKPVHRKPVSIS